MSLVGSPITLIKKYGSTTTLNGNAAGKAHWKAASLSRTQQYAKDSEWGRVAWEIWLLPTVTQPVNGQSISRSGNTCVVRAVIPVNVEDTLAYYNVIAFPQEGE